MYIYGQLRLSIRVGKALSEAHIKNTCSLIKYHGPQDLETCLACESQIQHWSSIHTTEQNADHWGIQSRNTAWSIYFFDVGKLAVTMLHKCTTQGTVSVELSDSLHFFFDNHWLLRVCSQSIPHQKSVNVCKMLPPIVLNGNMCRNSLSTEAYFFFPPTDFKSTLRFKSFRSFINAFSTWKAHGEPRHGWAPFNGEDPHKKGEIHSKTKSTPRILPHITRRIFSLEKYSMWA